MAIDEAGDAAQTEINRANLKKRLKRGGWLFGEDRNNPEFGNYRTTFNSSSADLRARPGTHNDRYTDWEDTDPFP